MRPSSPTSTINLWHSPIAYLFGGLAAVLILISVALIVLACSNRKNHDTSSREEEKPVRPVLPALDPEPKIVVIMAGNDKPTYLATAIATPSVVTTCTCDQV